MKPLLHFFSVLLFLSLSLAASAQIIPGIQTISTTTYNFDTLVYPFMTIDTSGMFPWQIGTTVKPYFSSPDTPALSIMTLHSGAYPVNANHSFTLKFPSLPYNVIISFAHKYETDSGKDGGIVEVSKDQGITWENVKGDCNMDSMGYRMGIHTEGFYAKTDSLYTGAPGFSGHSGGWRKSAFQFMGPMPVKGTNSCNFLSGCWVRFRFLSDSVADNMDGWLIDSIGIRRDEYAGGVGQTEASSLKVYPNPSVTGVFHFQELVNEREYHIGIRNVLGQLMEERPYAREIDLSKYRNGLYFYQVSNGGQHYTGTLVFE